MTNHRKIAELIANNAIAIEELGQRKTHAQNMLKTMGSNRFAASDYRRTIRGINKQILWHTETIQKLRLEMGS